MTRLHELLIIDVLDARSNASEAEQRSRQRAEQLNELTSYALLNGVTAEQLATALQVPVTQVERWAELAQQATR